MTCATVLFRAGVHEKLIKEITGHRSNAVGLYNRTAEEQYDEISNILMGRGAGATGGRDDDGGDVEQQGAAGITATVVMEKQASVKKKRTLTI